MMNIRRASFSESRVCVHIFFMFFAFRHLRFVCSRMDKGGRDVRKEEGPRCLPAAIQLLWRMRRFRCLRKCFGV